MNKFMHSTKIIKSKILRGRSSTDKMKNKMPGIINGIIKNNLDISQENTCDHTEGQENMYNHIYRKKTNWELWRLSFTMMGVEIVYAAVTAFISPILLMYGVRREYATLVWAIGPLFGFLVSPVLGSLSDQCKFSIGRRRPFILILAILDVIGLLLIANSNVIGSMFGDAKSEIFAQNISIEYNEFSKVDVSDEDDLINNYLATVILIVVGTILVDFATDTLLNPSRAYVLDVCVIEDHDKVLSVNTLLAGFGGFFGYIIGWINWRNTILYEVIDSYVQIVFYLVAILFVVCVLMTVTTFKEVPLKNPKLPNTQSIEDFNPNMLEEKKPLKDYLKSIISMPHSLKILWVTNLLCWMSHVNFYLYFTHFVAYVVFDGDPTASSHTVEYQRYENGIRFGCIALSGNCITSILYSFVARKIIKTFGLKQVYIVTILLDAVCLMTMAFVKSKLFVLILSAMSGIIYCTSFTIPYMLVAHYHAKNVFNRKDTPSTQIRGLGTDLSIIGTCICVAQLINSLIMGKMTSIFGVTFAVIGSSSILGFLAAGTASQILYMDM